MIRSLPHSTLDLLEIVNAVGLVSVTSPNRRSVSRLRLLNEKKVLVVTVTRDVMHQEVWEVRITDAGRLFLQKAIAARAGKTTVVPCLVLKSVTV